MRGFPTVLLLGLLAWGASVEAAPRKIVAVLPLVDQTGLPPARVEALSDYLRIRIGALGVVDVVDKGLQAAETKRMVSEAQEESYKACVDEACQIPLGKQLAANYILRGQLQSFESTTVLSLELIDVGSAASTAAVSERIPPGTDAVLAAIDHLSEQLGARLSGAPAPPPPAMANLFGTSIDEDDSGLGGLGVRSSTTAVVYGYGAPPPPEDGPSTVRGVVYLGVAAAILAGGLALDLGPDSAHNGGLDFLDLVPLVLYGTSFFFGMAGIGNLL